MPGRRIQVLPAAQMAATERRSRSRSPTSVLPSIRRRPPAVCPSLLAPTVLREPVGGPRWSPDRRVSPVPRTSGRQTAMPRAAAPRWWSLSAGEILVCRAARADNDWWRSFSLRGGVRIPGERRFSVPLPVPIARRRCPDLLPGLIGHFQVGRWGNLAEQAGPVSAQLLLACSRDQRASRGGQSLRSGSQIGGDLVDQSRLVPFVNSGVRLRSSSAGRRYCTSLPGRGWPNQCSRMGTRPCGDGADVAAPGAFFRLARQ